MKIVFLRVIPFSHLNHIYTVFFLYVWYSRRYCCSKNRLLKSPINVKDIVLSLWIRTFSFLIILTSIIVKNKQ